MSRPLTYRALDQLVAKGCAGAVAVEPGIAGGNRTILAITRRGRARLREWIVTPVDHLRDLRSALLLKLVIPSGYMIGEAQGHMAIVLCPGTMPVADAMSHAPSSDMTTMHGMSHGVMADHGRSDHRDGQHNRPDARLRS